MNQADTSFLTQFKGYFKSALRWEDLDALWATLRMQNDKQWYIYAVGEAVPQSTVGHDELVTFIQRIDLLLREEHDEDYCGIVYANNPKDPGFIKIYDPNNLGSVCGPGSAPPPLPGWVLSLAPPEDLEHARPQPGNRRRWWQNLFG